MGEEARKRASRNVSCRFTKRLLFTPAKSAAKSAAKSPNRSLAKAIETSIETSINLSLAIIQADIGLVLAGWGGWKGGSAIGFDLSDVASGLATERCMLKR